MAAPLSPGAQHLCNPAIVDVAGQEAALAALAEEEDAVVKQREGVEKALKSKKQETAKAENAKVGLQKQIKAEKAKLDKRQPDFIRAQQEREHCARRQVQAHVALQRARDAVATHEAAMATCAHECAATKQALADKQSAAGQHAIPLEVRDRVMLSSAV